MIRKSDRSFSKGLVLSVASDLLPPGALARAENVDLSKEGAIRPRKGHTAVNGSVLDQTTIHSHFKATKRYTGAGTKLYRDFTSILTGLTSGARFQFATMQPYADLLEWVFMANGNAAGMKKDDGTNLRNWGITAPATAPTTASGGVGKLDNGTYYYKVTFKNSATGFESDASSASVALTLSDEFAAPTTAATRALGGAGNIEPGTYDWVITYRNSTSGYESPAGPASAEITFGGGGASKQINLTAIPVSADPDVNQRRVYRKGGPNTVYKLVTTINDNVTTIYTDNTADSGLGAQIVNSGRQISLTAIPVSTDAQVDRRLIYRIGNTISSYLLVATISDNTTTTYTDNTADADLGVALTDGVRTPPPVVSKLIEHQGHLLATGNASYPTRVYWSRANQPEAWPASNYLEIGSAYDPPQALTTFGLGVYVFTRKNIYQLLGPLDGDFSAIQTHSPVGTLAPYSVVSTPVGIFFVGTDLQIWLFNGSTSRPVSKKEAGFDVSPLFNGVVINGNGSLNSAAVAECYGVWFENRYWLSYPDGTSTVCNKMMVYDALHDRWTSDSRAFRCLATELTNLLVAGAADGFVYRLENGQADNGGNITMTVDLPEQPLSDEHSLVVLRRYRVDMDTLGGSVTLGFNLDGTSVLSAALNIDRTAARVRRSFAAKKRGHRLKPTLSYVGQLAPEFYGIEVEYEVLKGVTSG